jgi:2-amino-4-hydroxy-6-hydroxymethyldihydropteridine diphosphokinase
VPFPNPAFSAAHLAFIALGSNLGDPRQNVRRAMDRLQAFSDSPLFRSSLWLSTPVDCPPDSPPYINAAIGLRPRPTETAGSLLEKLLCLEREFGPRARKVANESRTLDLDLIAFRNEIRNSRSLILPHPRAHLRRFVLLPLSEIAPDLILPGQRQTVRRLLDILPASAGDVSPAQSG